MEKQLVPDLPADGVCRAEITVKRSRFIASAGRASDRAGAEAFIARIRAEFPGARHNCYAFNCGPAGSSALIGCSDDGEPKGTAGQPMLNLVRHAAVGELCVVVTRYFGGTLLGTGGLIRAYQDAVRAVLAILPVKEYRKTRVLTAELPYSLVGAAIFQAGKFGAEIRERRCAGETATLTVEVPAEAWESFRRALAEKCGGRVAFPDRAGEKA